MFSLPSFEELIMTAPTKLDDTLLSILDDNDLFIDLHDILEQNHLSMTELRSMNTNSSSIADYCKESQMNQHQINKFHQLIQIINTTDETNIRQRFKKLQAKYDQMNDKHQDEIYSLQAENAELSKQLSLSAHTDTNTLSPSVHHKSKPRRSLSLDSESPDSLKVVTEIMAEYDEVYGEDSLLQLKHDSASTDPSPVASVKNEQETTQSIVILQTALDCKQSEYEKLQQELKNLKGKYDSRSDQDKLIKSKMNGLKKELNALKIKNHEYMEQNTALTAKYDDLIKDSSEAQKALNKKFEKFKQKHNAMKKRHIKTVKALKDQFQHDIDAKNQQLTARSPPTHIRMRGKRTKSENAASLEAVMEHEVGSQKQISNLKNEIKQMMKELDQERKSKESIQRSKSCSESDYLLNLKDQDKVINKLKNENEAMNDKLSENLDVAVEKYEHLQNDSIQNLQQLRASAKDAYGKLENDRNDLQTSIDELQDKYQDAKQENTKMKKQVESANISNEDIVKELNDQIHAMREDAIAKEQQIKEIMHKLEEEKTSKQRIQRSKSCSDTDNANLSQQFTVLKGKYDKVSLELKEMNGHNNALRIRNEAMNAKIAKYESLIKEYDNKMDVVANLKEQIVRYQQQIQTMKEEKKAEVKRGKVNNLKYKVIESQSSLDLIKKELARVTKDVKIRLSTPQRTKFDGDLIDVLLGRQTKLIKEYKREYDLAQQLNQELDSQMTA